MVYAKDDPYALARVTVVSVTGTLVDLYVRIDPADVLDYRTQISGVSAQHLTEESGALPFAEVQAKVLACIDPETILVGHALQNDLKALQIVHNKIVDTALLFAVEGKQHWQKHKLHSLVSLMRPRIATLQSVTYGQAHDSRQDAMWALQIALYEASIYPRRTGALRLESFPTKVFLEDIPNGTSASEVQALFRGGDVGTISFSLQVPQNPLPGERAENWVGTTTVTFASQADRDAAIAALARFACVFVGPLRDWAMRRDIPRMQTELIEHFSRYGRVRGCRVFRPRAGHGQLAIYPVAQLTCHPATARALLTKGEAHSFATHRSLFKVRLAEEDSRKRCIVPLGANDFVAKIK